MPRCPTPRLLAGAAALALGAALLLPAASAVLPTEGRLSRPRAVSAGAAAAPHAEAFVVLHGSDTLAVERFSRSPERLEGELLDIGQSDLRETYLALLRPDGLVSRFELAVRPGNTARDTPPVRRAAVIFRPGEAVAEIRRGGPASRERLDTAPGALPYLPLSYALLEQATLRARALGAERVELALLDVDGGRTLSATVARAGQDSVTIEVDGLEMQARVDAEGRIVGGRIPARGVMIQRVRSFERLGEHDYSAPLDAPYVAEQVRLRATARHSLAGTLTLPSDVSGPFPAVVLVTGSGPQERDATYLGTYRPFRQIADALSRRGIAVLRLDDRGVGASTGDFTRATSADFADDVRSALVFLRQRADIDGDRVALLGESEGGLIASMVAASDSELRGLVLMGTPSRTGRDLIASQIRYRLERDGVEDPARRDSILVDVERKNDRLARALPWLRFILDYDPIPTAVRIRTPVLILQGANDRQVPPSQAGELGVALRGGGNTDVTVRIFPSLNHLFLDDPDGDPEGYQRLRSKAIPEEVLAGITQWLTERLRHEPLGARGMGGA